MTVSKWVQIGLTIFTVGMIVLFVMRLTAGLWVPLNWGMMLVPAIACLLIFVCFVYVFNYSYSLSAIGNGLLIFIALPSVASGILCGAYILYGVRLLWFTHTRTRSQSYAGHTEQLRANHEKLPLAVKWVLWVQCMFLYTFQCLGIYLAASQVVVSASLLAGAGVILLGTLLEAVADGQKQAFKAREPDNFIATGLYARWRHPNYAGEVVVQIGLLVAGVGAVSAGWANYAAVAIAPLFIVFLMFSQSRSKDRAQIENYGERDDYQQYLRHSSSLIPGL